MNVSFNPNQTLGRMLYTFSCTAYEIGEADMENLKNNKLINYTYDENSVLPEPQPEPEPEPDYRKGYVDKETFDSEVEVIEHPKETTVTEVDIFDAADVVYHTL